MPDRCHQEWDDFHLRMINKYGSGSEKSKSLYKSAVVLAKTLPSENFGTPEAPLESECGPNRDGTWPPKFSLDGLPAKATKDKLFRTELERFPYEVCQSLFARHKLHCTVHFMYWDDVEDCQMFDFKAWQKTPWERLVNYGSTK